MMTERMISSGYHPQIELHMFWFQSKNYGFWKSCHELCAMKKLLWVVVLCEEAIVHCGGVRKLKKHLVEQFWLLKKTIVNGDICHP